MIRVRVELELKIFGCLLACSWPYYRL